MTKQRAAKPFDLAPQGLERFPIAWSHVIEKEELKFQELEHVLTEKSRAAFLRTCS
jgi:hypothetical protein